MDPRRLVATGVVLTLAAGAAVAVSRRTPDRGSAAAVVVDPVAPGSSPADGAGSPSPDAPASPSPSAGPAAAAPSPDGPVATAPVESPDPLPSPSVSLPPALPSASPTNEPPPTSWQGRSGHLRVSLRVDRARVDAGHVVDFFIESRPTVDSWDVYEVALAYGDGAVLPDDGLLPCEGWGQSVWSRRATYARHGYRYGGNYRFTLRVVASSRDCSDSDEVTISGTIHVDPAEAGSNGPLFPDRYRGDGEIGPDGYRFAVAARDEDGYITRIEVDWGDGSEPEVFTYPLGDCRDLPGRWPYSERTTPAVAHQYADGERARDARVRIDSTGCDGKNWQRITYQMFEYG